MPPTSRDDNQHLRLLWLTNEISHHNHHVLRLWFLEYSLALGMHKVLFLKLSTADPCTLTSSTYATLRLLE